MKKFIYFILVILIAFIIFVLNFKFKHSKKNSFYSSIKTGQNIDKDILKPSNFRLKTIEKIKKSKNFDDIFEIVKVVKLESKNDNFVVNARDLVMIDQSFFILDDVQNQVYQYNFEGKFIRKIGRIGQGLGEYQTPKLLKKAFNNNISVYCSTTGRIIVYDINGKYVTEYNPNKKSTNRILGYNFIWKDKDILYKNAFPIYEKNNRIPENIKIDLKENKILKGFGTRTILPNKLNQQVSSGTLVFNAIGNYIWFGSPFNSKIEIFDFDCNRVKKIIKTQKNRLKLSDFKNIKKTFNSNYYKLLRKKRNYYISQTNNLVILDTGDGYFDVYDKYANLLVENISLNKQFIQLFTGFDNLLISVRDNISNSKTLKPIVKKYGYLDAEIKNDDSFLFILESKY